MNVIKITRRGSFADQVEQYGMANDEWNTSRWNLVVRDILNLDYVLTRHFFVTAQASGGRNEYPRKERFFFKETV